MKKILVVTVLALMLGGCATFSPSYKSGNRAELNKNWDEAISLYEKAALYNPREPVYRLALARVKQAAGLDSLQAGRQLAARGKKDEALAAYDKALRYDPLNTLIIAERNALAGTPVVEEKPPLEKIEPPIKLKVKEEKLVLNFPGEAGLRSLFLTLAKTAGVNILFDETFRDIPFTLSLSDVSFDQALNALCTATKNFFRIIDERTLIVVPDVPMKRLQYDINVIRSFPLSNIRAEEILQILQQMLSPQFKAVKVLADKNLNIITVRDTPATIALAAKLIRLWDRPRAEVVINMEFMEVSRTKLRQLGISFDQNGFGLRYGAPPTPTSDSTAGSAASSWVNLKGVNLGQSGNYYASLPVAFLEFLQTDSDTKIIAQPRLRGISDESIETMVGQRIPIPQTTFTPIAAGGINQQPVTSFEYKDIGINVKVKPRVHVEGDITLEMDLEITSLGGTGYANIPVISTRKVKNIIRLKDGETNLLAGLLRDEERKSLTGIPGLQDLPLIGRLFAHEVTNLEQTDVILTITPYIIRRVPVSAEDSKPIWVDLEQPASTSGGGGGGEEDYYEPGAASGRMPPTVDRPEAGGTAQIMFSPGNFELPKGRDFQITVNSRNSQPVGNFSATVTFNPQVMRLKEVTPGVLLRQGGGNMPFFKNIDNASGSCTLGYTSPDMIKGLSGSGPMAILLFESVAPGEGTVTALSVAANGPGGKPVTFEVRPARVVIR